MRVHRLRWAVMASCAILMLMAPAPASATTASAVRFMEFNYCGTACNNGYYAHDLEDVAQGYRPAVILIVEICETQLITLQNRLASQFPYPYRRFDFLKNRTACLNGGGSNQRFGNAILTSKAQLGSASTPLRNPGGPPSEEQRILCVTTWVGVDASPVAMAACVTHIDDTDANKAHQENNAKAFALDYAGSYPLLYGGDFNMRPPDSRLNDVYYNNGSGVFQEMDQCPDQDGGRSGGGPASQGFTCNRWTTNSQKIDFMFFEQSKAQGAGRQSPINVPSSDHHIYYGAMNICSIPC